MSRYRPTNYSRDMPHQVSRLGSPIELKGRSVIKSPMVHETYGRWEDFIGNRRGGGKTISPVKVERRTSENKHAQRTIEPHMNKDQDKIISRRINSPLRASRDSSIVSLMEREGTIQDVRPGSKKTYKEKTMKGEDIYVERCRTGKRISQQRFEDYGSHISTLQNASFYPERTASPTAGFGYRAPSPMFSPTARTRQSHLMTSIGSLPCAQESKRDYQDPDEIKNLKSANSPRVPRHMLSTLLEQPTPFTSNIQPRRDPNRNNPTTYEDVGRLNPWTKGKKVDYREHKERNISTNWVAPSIETSFVSSSPKYGNMEPLNALFPGRRAQSPKAEFNNLLANPNSGKDNARGATVYSYRTYSSQVFA